MGAMGRVTDRRTVVRIDTAGATPGSGTAPTGAATAPTGTAPTGTAPNGAATAPTATLSATVVRRMDTLAGEEPMEIRVGRAGDPRRPLAVTMRTPGDDLDLALG